MTTIASAAAIAEVAALLGDPARASMIAALMGGRALTAGELALQAGVTAQTASGHLARLTEVGLLAQERQGRHRYFRIASREVAQAVEALTLLAAAGPARYRPPGPADRALRTARTCYDHMAGRLGVALADSLVARRHVLLADGAASVTDEGERFLAALGLDLSGGGTTRRPLCRACLDWSERRHHLAGRLGAALLTLGLDSGWVKGAPEGRVLTITRAGERAFADHFGVAADGHGDLAFRREVPEIRVHPP
jgi:DNA-binding transcriptional ArsR family regulator